MNFESSVGGEISVNIVFPNMKKEIKPFDRTKDPTNAGAARRESAAYVA